MSFLRRPGRRRFAAGVSAGTLASLACALVVSCLAHTDDGCAVELHCFACTWAFTGAAVAAAPLAVPIALVRAGSIATHLGMPPAGLPTPTSLSRGPPAR